MLASYVARLGLTTATSLFTPSASPLDEVRFRLTIWPQDLDVYGHLNNGRYLTLMDNGRLMHLLKTGLFRLFVERKWHPILGAASIEFRRELRAFQRCDLVTRVISWDAKWLFLEHRLEREGSLHARAIVRAVVKHGRRTVSSAELFEAVGLPGVASPLSSAQLEEQIRGMMLPAALGGNPGA